MIRVHVRNFRANQPLGKLKDKKEEIFNVPSEGVESTSLWPEKLCMPPWRYSSPRQASHHMYTSHLIPLFLLCKRRGSQHSEIWIQQAHPITEIANETIHIHANNTVLALVYDVANLVIPNLRSHCVVINTLSNQVTSGPLYARDVGLNILPELEEICIQKAQPIKAISKATIHTHCLSVCCS